MRFASVKKFKTWNFTPDDVFSALFSPLKPLSRNGPSHGVKRHWEGKYCWSLLKNIFCSHTHIFQALGCRCKFLSNSSFHCLASASKFLICVKTSSTLNIPSLFQLPRTEHDLEQPGRPDVSLPDRLCPLHVGHHHRLDQPLDCHDVGHLPKDTGLCPHWLCSGEPYLILSCRPNPMLSGSLGCQSWSGS